jgi:hypothetical protein
MLRLREGVVSVEVMTMTAASLTAIEAGLIVKHLSARRAIEYKSHYYCSKLTNSLRAPEKTVGSVGGIQA